MTASQELRAVAGDVALTAIDAAQEALRGVARHVLAERVASGYLDLPAHEIEHLARKLALESRVELKRLVFVVHMAARDYGTADASEDPTRPVVAPYRAPAPDRKDPPR